MQITFIRLEKLDFQIVFPDILYCNRFIILTSELVKIICTYAANNFNYFSLHPKTYYYKQPFLIIPHSFCIYRSHKSKTYRVIEPPHHLRTF